MGLKSYQSCRTNDGWIPVQVASDTRPLDYLVLVCPWDSHLESICECPGYIHHGHCKHQVIAHESLCRWDELLNPEEQTEAQRKKKICPRCGGPTQWQLEVVDDAEDEEG